MPKLITSLIALLSLVACSVSTPEHTVESRTASRIVLVSDDPGLDHDTARKILDLYEWEVTDQVVLKKPTRNGELKIYAAKNIKAPATLQYTFSDTLFQ